MGGLSKDPGSAVMALGGVLAQTLAPLVELERATIWVDAQEDRFFSIDYHGVSAENPWEFSLFVDAEDAKRLELEYPNDVKGAGLTLAAALKDALSKVYPS